MRENRIKDFAFPNLLVNGSNLAGSFTSHVLNGEIVRVTVQGVSSPGSLCIVESGTGIEVWRKNDFTSGAAAIEAYPFVYGVNSTNTTGSPQVFASRIINNHLYVVGSGFTSGAGKEFGPIVVYYR